jgi:phosphate-selective porin
MKKQSELKTKVSLVMGCLCLSATSFAQMEEPELTPVEKLEQKTEMLENAVKTLQKLKVSGYLQTQWQYGEKDASLKVGNVSENPEESFSRFGIRRGRIKFAYEDGIASGVFQLDITEKGVGIKDVYLLVKDPWFNANGLKAGVFDRPFGNEISYSSSRRESPERSTVFQTLFPEERDLGALLLLQPAKTSAWNFLKLEAGLFAGNGIKQETDSRKDFIGHLSADKNIGSDMRISGGVSYYNGSVYQGTENVYRMEGKSFVPNNDARNKGQFAKREYIGFDAQFSLMSVLGMTQLRAEYLFGEQPGAEFNSKSPNASILPATDTYIRNFKGGYAIFVQDFGTLPLSGVLKYDWYDPNTKVSKSDIGQHETAAGDVAYNTFGFGLLWRVNNNVRLQTFYEINTNETSGNLAGYEIDRKDNVFTLRAQYKF